MITHGNLFSIQRNAKAVRLDFTEDLPKKGDRRHAVRPMRGRRVFPGSPLYLAPDPVYTNSADEIPFDGSAGSGRPETLHSPEPP
jgi:hypothetical protein